LKYNPKSSRVANTGINRAWH